MNVAPLMGHLKRTIFAFSGIVLLVGGTVVARAGMREEIVSAKAAGANVSRDIFERLKPLSPRQIADLRLALADADPFVIRTSVEMLTLAGDAPLASLSRLLQEGDVETRPAVEEALVAAGPAAVPFLTELSAKLSCASPARLSAARVLGRIGDASAVPALLKDLESCRAGGLELSVVFDALGALGAPSILPLVDVTRFHALKGKAYHALLRHDPALLARELRAALANPEIDPGRRLFYAQEARLILGSEVAARDIAVLLASLEKEGMSAPAVAGAVRDLRESSTKSCPPLSLGEVEAKYGDAALAKRYEEEDRAEEQRKRKIREAADAGARRRESVGRKEQTERERANDRAMEAWRRKNNCDDWMKKHVRECQMLSEALQIKMRRRGSPATPEEIKPVDECWAQLCPY